MKWALTLWLSATALLAVEITGRVVDPGGAGVPSANVTVVQASQARAGSASTDATGRFRIVVPGPGSYAVNIARASFAPLRVAIEVEESGGPEFVFRLGIATALSSVTVSAEAGRSVDPDQVPQSMTLISRESLDQHTGLLSAAVSGQVGVQELRTSPTLGAIFVRGLTGKNVAVFRDGVRMTTSAQRGGISTFLNLVPTSGLESVEVLRGPNSAQYGSDSLGGAVGLVSPSTGIGWHGGMGTLYESAARGFGSTASVGYGNARFGFTARGAGQRSNTLRTGGGLDSHAAVTRFLGLPSNVLGDRLPDTAFTGYGGSLHGQVRLGREAQLIGHYERGQQDGGKRYDQLLGGDGNLVADLRNLMLDFGYLRWQKFHAGPLDQISVTGSYNAQREERVNQGGQGDPAGAVTHQYEKTKATGVQAMGDRRWGRVDWLAGGEMYFERIVAPSFSVRPLTGGVSLVRPRIPDGARYRQYGGFTQASWRPWNGQRLRLSGALRYGGAAYESRAVRSPLVNGRRLWPDDSYSGSALTGRMGAVSWLREGVGIHANYSRGFRVPNVTDLGTVGLQGNWVYETAFADLAGRGALLGDRADEQARSTGRAPERLRPEVTNNFDMGGRLRRGRWEAEVSTFWLHLSNSIVSQTLLLPAGAVGQALGEQTVVRQLESGAVFVPISTAPVLVRGNFSGARMRGWEQRLRVQLTKAWSVGENMTSITARDAITGRPPDIEPGVPPLTVNPVVAWRPAGGRFWAEAYATLADRQERLSSLALSDRRIGNPRSRANIQSFFQNGARVRGLVRDGILLPTGETLGQVQNRVLGGASSAPQFTAIAGYAVVGLRGGMSLGEKTDVSFDLTNLGDKNYRGIGWGVDGVGRAWMVQVRRRF